MMPDTRLVPGDSLILDLEMQAGGSTGNVDLYFSIQAGSLTFYLSQKLDFVRERVAVISDFRPMDLKVRIFGPGSFLLPSVFGEFVTPPEAIGSFTWIAEIFDSRSGVSLSRSSVNFTIEPASCCKASLIDYGTGAGQGQALLCRPEGDGPFPAVIYNHGLIVDVFGYQGAALRGYNLDGICEALAKDGFLAFIPIRRSGRGNIAGHKEEVLRAIDYVKTRPDVDPSRIALMGFSRGGLLTLMVGVERNDLKALLILAPAPGRGYFAEAVRDVSSISVPVLLLVETGDDPWILEDVDMLEQALQVNGKEALVIRYDRGGGHRLFWDVDYYWEDVRVFLSDKLGKAP